MYNGLQTHRSARGVALVVSPLPRLPVAPLSSSIPCRPCTTAVPLYTLTQPRPPPPDYSLCTFLASSFDRRAHRQPSTADVRESEKIKAIVMAEEYLYGVTLDGAKTSEVWDPEPKNDESDSNQHFGVDQKLIIKMALLGPEAKSGELNVLQVEAMGLKGPIKIPIALLEMGKTSQIILDLSFPDPPVTFTLIKGSGPVHIVGHNLLATHMDEFEDMEDEEVEVDNFDDEDDEKDAEDEEDEDEEPKKKKNKIGAAPKNKNQVSKNQNQNQNQKKK